MAVIAIPPIVKGIVMLGGMLGIGHQVVPGKEGREQSIRDLANAMSNAQNDAKTKATGGTTAATCAAGNCPPPPDGGCRFDKYKDLECGDKEDAHHIISDYVLRFGKRLDTASRLLNAPSLNEGPSICLKEDEHKAVHKLMDSAVKELGPNGTLGQVKDIAFKAIEEVKSECKGKMKGLKDQVNKAFEKMGDGAPVRTQKSPLPKGESLDRLFGGVGRRGK
jgi:hypothetical protein